jgi:DNA repair exonuclease SbcCD ATPase subunit
VGTRTKGESMTQEKKDSSIPLKVGVGDTVSYDGAFYNVLEVGPQGQILIDYDHDGNGKPLVIHNLEALDDIYYARIHVLEALSAKVETTEIWKEYDKQQEALKEKDAELEDLTLRLNAVQATRIKQDKEIAELIAVSLRKDVTIDSAIDQIRERDKELLDWKDRAQGYLEKIHSNDEEWRKKIQDRIKELCDIANIHPCEHPTRKSVDWIIKELKGLLE